MIKHYSLQSQGILLALFAMLTFSINDGIFKYALYSTSFDIVVSVGYVCSIVFLGLYGWFKKIHFMPQSKKNGLMFGGLFLLEQTTFIYALKHIPIAELFVVVLAAPVSVLIMSSLFLKEHLEKRQIAAVILGFAGALTVVSFPILFADKSETAAIPHLAWTAAIANIFFNSSKIIFMRKYCQTENTLSLSILACLFVAVFFGLQVSPTSFHLSALNFSLLLAGGCIGALGCIAYVRAFQLAKAPLISATQYSQIIWAVLMGVFIFREDLTWSAITGSLLILSSGYLLYLRKNTAR